MDTPYIYIHDEKIEPTEPTMGVWRRFMKLTDKQTGDITVPEFVENAIEMIELVFSDKRVTKASIDECMKVSEIVPLARKVSNWMQSLVFEKLQAIPNEDGAQESDKQD